MFAVPICLGSRFSTQTVCPRADKIGMRIRNSIGCPVEGQNFFNRDDEQAELWHRLETDHVLLLAPRRVGKTSLLYRLEATAERHGFKSIYVSVASHSTEVALLRALIEKVAEPGRFGRKLVNAASSGSSRSASAMSASRSKPSSGRTSATTSFACCKPASSLASSCSTSCRSSC